MIAHKIPHNSDPDGVLQRIECFALDLDGTIYFGDRWIAGALEFLEKLEETSRKYAFMTNNSSRSTEDYLEKLRRMGFAVTDSRVVTSGQATIRLLRRDYADKKVLLMGTPSLAREFLDAGIKLEDESPDLIVTAFDTALNYKRICDVCKFLREGMPYIATHPDINCPTETGFIPDVGAFHALIEASTGRKPDVTVGKPNREIIDAMLEKTGSRAETTAVIGDRLYTDIAAGVNNGLSGILVLSGEASLDDLAVSPVKPDLIFDSVNEIIPYL